MNKNKKAVVLLSGGLDSTTVIFYAKSLGFDIFAVSFDYGQKNKFEFQKAKIIAESAGAKKHHVAKIDLSAFGGSSLTSDIEVEKDRPLSAIGDGIPLTYVPARNTIFLSFALGWAEVIGAQHIFIGVNATDYSGYPDCRPEFIAAFEKVANIGTKSGVEGAQISIHTPLIHLTKAETIKLGLSVGADYSTTITCYDPTTDGLSCGRCDACILRLRGFAELGLNDPIEYVAGQ